MKYLTDIMQYESRYRSAVTLGKFDGLHRGHQLLLQQIKKIKKESTEKLCTVVVAFDMGREMLLTAEEKRLFLEEEADCLIHCPFSKNIREMEAEDFIKTVLMGILQAAYIVVGTDFRFGYGKKGTPQMLEEYAEKYGYQVKVIKKETYQGREISSTYIRETLKDGNVSLAKELLGYPYRICGTVVHGNRLGRTLGFPTMNLVWPNRKTTPCFGVYFCRVQIEESVYGGIANIGVKPTVSEKNAVLAEVHVLNYQGDAYGKTVSVEFLLFRRSEKKFETLEALKGQIEKDKVFALQQNGHMV